MSIASCLISLLCLFFLSCNLDDKTLVLNIDDLKPTDSIPFEFSLVAEPIYKTSTNFKGYFTFFKNNQDTLFFISPNSKKICFVSLKPLIKKLNISRVSNVWLENKDSIYVLGFANNKIALINREGVFIDEYSLSDKKNNIDSGIILNPCFKNPILKVNDRFIIGFQNMSYTNYLQSMKDRSVFFGNGLNIALKLVKSELILDGIIGKYPSFFVSDASFYDWQINSSFNPNNNTLNFVFSNIDSIYSYEINSGIAHSVAINNQFYTNNSSFDYNKLVDYKYINSYYLNNNFYQNFIYNSFENKFYLIYEIADSHGELNITEANNKPFIIIKMDANFKVEKYIKFPAKRFIVETLSFNKNGLLIASQTSNNMFYEYKL